MPNYLEIAIKGENKILIRSVVANLFKEMIPKNTNITFQVWNKLVEKVTNDKKMVKLLNKYIEIITSDDFLEAIKNGYFTYTMFKPNIGKALLNQKEVPEDKEDNLIQKWRGDFKDKGLEVLAPVSIVMTPDTFGEFYKENKNWQSEKEIPEEEFPPYVTVPKNKGDRNLWKLIEGGMTSGPTTPAIVYVENPIEGNGAVQQLREELGPSNPGNDRDKFKDSFRSLNAKSSSNTLVHGSGSIEEVVKEVNWLLQKFQGLIQNAA